MLATILLEFIPNFANAVMDWGIWPEYTLCMNKEHQDNAQTLHKTVTWLFWDAIAILYVIQVICVIIWDYRSFRLVQKWVDAQDKYLVHNLSADDQEDKASLEFHDICGFQNIELKNPDHFLWI